MASQEFLMRSFKDLHQSIARRFDYRFALDQLLENYAVLQIAVTVREAFRSFAMGISSASREFDALTTYLMASTRSLRRWM
jgi:hypothetical protein